jgi:hypothetical protein
VSNALTVESDFSASSSRKKAPQRINALVVFNDWSSVLSHSLSQSMLCYTSLAVFYYLSSQPSLWLHVPLPIITSPPSQGFVSVFQQGARIGFGLGLDFCELRLSVFILVFFWFCSTCSMG